MKRWYDISYVLIALAALAQGVLWVGVFALFHKGVLAYIGGIPAGLAIVGIVARSANILPRVGSKRARNAGWIFLTILLVIEPVVLGFANWPAIVGTSITLVGSYVVAGGASLAVSLALVLGAIVDRSLVAVDKPKSKSLEPQSEPKSGKKSAKAKKADFVCRYAGAGCSQKFASQNAANAHARGCAYKPTIIDISEKAATK